MLSTCKTVCLALALTVAAAGSAPGQVRTLAPAQASLADDSAYWFAAGEQAAAEAGDIQYAAWNWQPPAAAPAIAGGAQQPATRTPRRSNARLASVPNMFGDLGLVEILIQAESDSGMDGFVSSTGVPLGGGRRTKVSENNRPIPTDRVFFNFNHFHNIFEVTERPTFPPGAPSVVRQQSLDRYTPGFEKTFLDGAWSVEVRMPFVGSLGTDLQSVGVETGNFGNLAVLLKNLLYMDDTTAIGIGVGIDTPTGSDVDAFAGDQNPIGLRFHNQSLHLLPFIGFVSQPNDQFFLTGFLQVDIATNGNDVEELDGLGNPTGELFGVYTDQNLLFVDVGAGYWLYRNPFAERWTGLAAVAEIHYITALQDSDVIDINQVSTDAVISNPRGRLDVVNFTAGIHAQMFNLTSLRVGCVVPLVDEDQRLFDAEIQVQFNRQF